MDIQGLMQAVVGFGHDNSGPIFLACVVLAVLVWVFFCWRSSWQKVYDAKTGKSRYLAVPYKHTPFITYPPYG